MTADHLTGSVAYSRLRKRHQTCGVNGMLKEVDRR